MAWGTDVSVDMSRIKTALGTFPSDFPARFTTPVHSHNEDQLLCASAPIMVYSPTSAWVVPSWHAVWIPAGIEHWASMVADVETYSVMVDTDLHIRKSHDCLVLEMSPLLKQLVVESAQFKSADDYPAFLVTRAKTECAQSPQQQTDRESLLLLLLSEELRRIKPLSLSLPIPRHTGLANKCLAFLARPTPHETIDAWCALVGMSRRSFTRHFREETGISFMRWRQQACLLASLPRLASGESVTTIAYDMGYGSPATFTTLFKREMGVTPTTYRLELAAEQAVSS